MNREDLELIKKINYTWSEYNEGELCDPDEVKANLENAIKQAYWLAIDQILKIRFSKGLISLDRYLHEIKEKRNA